MITTILSEIREVRNVKRNIHLKIFCLEESCVSKHEIRDKIFKINKEIELTVYNPKIPIDEELIEKGTELIAQKEILIELLGE